MPKLTIPDLSLHDLEKIAKTHKCEKNFVNKIQVVTTKERVLNICRDEPTRKNIDIIRSASIKVDGIWFELLINK